MSATVRTMHRCLVALAALGACWSTAPEPPAAPAPPVATGQIHRFRIGALEAIALKDGDIEIANDGKTLGLGRSPEDVGNVLASAGLPRDPATLSIQPLLVKDGAHLLLFDTGAGREPWARGGLLFASLARAGVSPAEITDIFLSHGHADHTGGLVGPDHVLAFPNAVIHVSAPEWEAMQAGKLAPSIAPRVVPFEPGAQILPEVLAVATHGHTPGHSSYVITSQSDSLFYLGDVAHHSIVSVQRPAWTIEYDTDAPAAEATRLRTLQALSRGMRIYAVHFPFPGLGRIEATTDSFLWEPEVSPDARR